MRLAAWLMLAGKRLILIGERLQRLAHEWKQDRTNDRKREA